jgi:hypothetical protein
LNDRAVNPFRNALQRKPRSDLFEHHIGPDLYHLGPYYMYKPRPEGSAKNQELTKNIFLSDLFIGLSRPLIQ